MRAHDLWKDEPEGDWATTLVCLERLLFHKVRSATFNSTPEDDIVDRQFRRHVAALEFMEPSHVGVKDHIFPLNEDGSSSWRATLSKPTEVLGRLDELRSPTDMHDCIKEFTVLIGDMLRTATGGGARGDLSSPLPGRAGSALGADDFLPHIILCIREAKPAHLKACTTFLEQYTRPRRLNAEPGYLLTQLLSAVHFLDSADSEALNMDPELYQRGMLQGKEKAEAEMRETNARNDHNRQQQQRHQQLDVQSCTLSPVASLPAESKLLEALKARGPPSIGEVSRGRSAGILQNYA